ncbi:MAG TPA: class I SAM-dependent methyltransferase [Natronosporangium sp.]|nr:class I SAM-dependent methyltransferase [Natronosporangium sp.]
MAAEHGGTRLQSEVLEDLRGARHYRRWLVSLVAPYLGDHPIELGSGIGDYAAELAVGRSGYTATEPDPERLAVLTTRFAGHPVVRVRGLSLPAAERADHTAAVMLNVLEHIEDDVAALRSAAGLVRPGGAVVVFVPAFPALMSRFDRLIGHYRRYTRRSLAAALAAAGLPVERLHYVNSVGLVSWFLLMRCARMIPRDGPALRCYDATVIRAVAGVERHLRPPFGQSVFAVARVPA